MCQLTMLDIQDGFLDTSFLESLLSVNSLEGNLDGFGYYKFNGSMFKTNKSFPEWFLSNDSKDFRKDKFINGLYHVRFASTNKENITEPTAHPHKLESIVLLHNGTLTKFYVKTLNHIFSKYNYAKEDITDSVEFLMALHYYSYGEGSEEIKGVTNLSIKKALNLFSGNFVILILDTNFPDVMYIVKDEKVKPLSVAKVFDNEKPVGLILNSKFFMLQSAFFLYKNIFKRSNLKFNISEVAGNKIYAYKFNEYNLEELDTLPGVHQVPELDLVVSKPSVVTTSYRTVENDYNLFNTINEIMSNSFFTVDDIVIMYELMFEESIMFATNESIAYFLNCLKDIDDKTTGIKDLYYTQLFTTYNGNRKMIYTKHKLQFPYSLNSIEELERAVKSLYANTQKVQ